MKPCLHSSRPGCRPLTDGQTDTGQPTMPQAAVAQKDVKERSVPWVIAGTGISETG